MILGTYFFFALVFELGAYYVWICIRDFRRTRKSGALKPYLNALGMLLPLG
jgi:hypothetical protein